MLSARQLNRTTVTDDGVAALAGQTSLRNLELENDAITDLSMVTIARFARLESLSLRYDSRLTDVGLQQLASLKQLRKLNLWHTGANDNTLVRLAELKHLEDLSLLGARASLMAIAKLQSALPHCRIDQPDPSEPAP